jgi:tetratricopeptide (TPR) repeat protein
LNAELLDEIARTAHGVYAPLRGANTIETLYQSRLAPLPRTTSNEKWLRRPHERYHWPLALAIVLLCAEFLLPDRKRRVRNVPAADAPASRERTAGAAVPAATAILALLWFTPAAFGSPGTAMRDYRAGRFIKAQHEYERLAAADKVSDARLIFNAGTAAYRATNYDVAIKMFMGTVATARDVKLQQAAWYNLGNAQFRIGQTGTDLDEIQQRWEEAIKSYQNAVTLDQKDADAAFNLALARNGVEQIKQLRDAARLARLAADEATRRRNYHRALEIMQALLQQNPFGKPFEEYVKKLQNIDAIATPPQ